MSITKLKLQQYLKILRKNIPGNSVDDIHQSLDGIEEVCIFVLHLDINLINFFLVMFIVTC